MDTISSSAEIPHSETLPGGGTVFQNIAASVPLVVDLDYTLVMTDTLFESGLRLLFEDPRLFISRIPALLKGRKAIKDAFIAGRTFDAAALPFNKAALDLIAEARREGRRVHLVTAADQRIADAVGAHLGLFDSVTGTSAASANLKSVAKRDLLVSRFPQGFLYAGDAVADIPIIEASAGCFLFGYLAEHPERVAGLSTPVLHAYAPPHASFKDWIKLFRIHQWAKNGLILLPLFLAHQATNVALLMHVCMLALAFSAAASATYIINDLADLPADRSHPRKRRRAIARGVVSVPTAIGLAAVLLIGGLAVMTVLQPQVAMVGAGYVAPTLAYSFGLKRVPLLDVYIIGILFTLRVVIGMLAIGEPISLWLSSFVAALFLSLAASKRHSELMRLSREIGRGDNGRGYLVTDAPLTLSLGMTTGMLAPLILTLYLQFEAVAKGLYTSLGWMYLAPLVLGAWTLRIWTLSHRGQLHDDPVIFAFRDRISLAYGAAVFALWGLASI